MKTKWDEAYEMSRRILLLVVLALSAVALVFAIGGMNTARQQWQKAVSTVSTVDTQVPTPGPSEPYPGESFSPYPQSLVTSWTIMQV